MDEKANLRFSERGAGVEQFGENWLDDGGPVLVHVRLNFKTGREVTHNVIYFLQGRFFKQKRGGERFSFRWVTWYNYFW